MDKIVRLDSFKRTKATLQVPTVIDDGRWYIPDVYRLTGFEFDLARGEDASFPIASERPAPLEYTLYNKSTDRVANPEWTPINKLDPAVDKGWIVIRHHLNADRAYAYTLRELDLLLYADVPTSLLFGTHAGIFSLTHFPVASKGAPDHLLVYIRTRPGLDLSDMGTGSHDACQYLIYHPDGTVTHDSCLLYPRYGK